MRHRFALIALLLGGTWPALAQEHIHEVRPPNDDYVERMAQAHAHDYPVASPQAMQALDRGVSVNRITYGQYQGEDLKGYLALPRERGAPSAGLLVFHEWWGLNDNIEAMARMLAAQGYAALAVDFYGGERATKPDRARALLQQTMADEAARQARIRAAHGYLEKTMGVRRIGAIGWCFGGTMTYEAAQQLADRLDAAVIYYGQVGTEKTALQAIRAPVLGIFGGADPSIPVSQAQAFERELEQLGGDVELKIYEGAPHAFANPSGQGFRPQAAKDAWAATRSFLAAHLRPDEP